MRAKYWWVYRAGFPFLVARQPSALERLRVAALRAELARRRGARRPLAWAAMTVGWSITAVAGAAAAARADTRQPDQRFVPRFRAYLLAALRHNATPDDMQRLYARTGRCPSVAPMLLFNRDGRIWRELNALQGANPDDVQDKARFYAICREHGLPAVPVLAAFAGGNPIISADGSALANHDLFSKSLSGNLGAGAAIWRFGENGYSGNGEIHASLDELLARLSGEDCIVQHLLTDRHELRDAGSTGLSSVRIATILRPDGQAEAIAAILLLSRGMISQNGEILGVDVGSGRIISRLDLDANVLFHPETAAGFAIAAVPDWDALVAMACRAHMTGFARFSSLGWDLVLAEQGNFLLEANLGWGMLLHQTLDRPFGITRLADSADHWTGVLDATSR